MKSIPAFDYLQDYAEQRADILAAVDRVLGSGQLILGAEGRAFEREFAASLGAGHAVGVGSGTDALIVTLTAAGVGPGDEVITVAHTATATVSAIRSTGATPVFCDVDRETALMDTAAVRELLSPRTRAIVPVHLYGNVVDIEALRAEVGGMPVAIVEDCAQAHGASLHGRAAGTLGDFAAFSFYPTKNLGAFGDAGMCFTTGGNANAEMRRIRMYGFEGMEPRALREGINSRMDELQAAILRLKLPALESDVQRRRTLAARYDEILDGRVRRVATGPGVEHGFHLYVVKLPRRDAVRAALAQRGIGTGIHYPCPVHLMPAYGFLGYRAGDLPATEELAASVLSLPLYPRLEPEAVERVCTELLDVLP